MKRLAIVALCASLSLADGSVDAPSATRSISFPSAKPSGAVSVSEDFVGFGFETAFLNDYANDFSENLVDSIADRMSVPPIIRIGGTSGDQVTYDPSQTAARQCIVSMGDCPNGSAAHFTLGPSYFNGFQRFQSAHMTFQAPLNRNGQNSPSNLTASLDYVRLAFKKLGMDRLAGIAIGNEVQYDSPASFYATKAKALESNITDLLNLTGSDRRIFEVLDLASGAVGEQSPFTLADAFQAGLNSNKLTKIAAEHYYQVDSKDPSNMDLQAELMNHTAIVSKFVNYGKSIAYLRANQPDVPYVLSETGSSLKGHGNFSDAFGACLWSVDFQLYAMSSGTARVDGSQRPAAAHSLWIPVAIDGDAASPSVRAPFYAQPFVADFIGKTPAATAAVAAVSKSVVNRDLKSDLLTAYALYEGSQLARVALVNLREWQASDGGNRGSQAFALKVPAGSASSTVRVARLHADTGAMARGIDVDKSQSIVWAGQQWAKSKGNGVPFPATATVQNVTVTGGVATVVVPDSEAVIVYLT